MDKFKVSLSFSACQSTECFFTDSVLHSVLLLFIKWHLLPHKFHNFNVELFFKILIVNISEGYQCAILCVFKSLESSFCRVILYFSLLQKGLHSVSPVFEGEMIGCEPTASPWVRMSFCLLHSWQEAFLASRLFVWFQVWQGVLMGISQRQYASLLLKKQLSSLPDLSTSWIYRSQWQESESTNHSRRGRGRAQSGSRAAEALGPRVKP